MSPLLARLVHSYYEKRNQWRLSRSPLITRLSSIIPFHGKSVTTNWQLLYKNNFLKGLEPTHWVHKNSMLPFFYISLEERGQTVHWIGAYFCVSMFLNSRDKSLNMFQNLSGLHLQKFRGFRVQIPVTEILSAHFFVADSATSKYS